MFELYGEGPPCGKCRPELKSCNYPFFILYDYVDDQVIMGMDGPVALRLSEIDKAMDHFNVDADERVLFSSKVRQIAREVMSLQHEELNKKREASRKRRK